MKNWRDDLPDTRGAAAVSSFFFVVVGPPTRMPARGAALTASTSPAPFVPAYRCSSAFMASGMTIGSGRM
jgi:hypothetical protein